MRNGIQFFCLCSLLILAACTPVQAADQATTQALSKAVIQADPSKPAVLPGEIAGQALASPESTWLPQKPSPFPAAGPSASPPSAPVFGAGVLVAVELGGRRGTEIRLVDPANGLEVPGYTLKLKGVSAYAFTSDARVLGVIESLGQSCEPYSGGSACWPKADRLHLVDLPDWQDRAVDIPGDGWSDRLAFSSDGARLALLLHGQSEETLLLYDALTGELLAQRALDFRPSHLAFTLEDTAIALYGQPESEDPGITQPAPPRALLVEAANLATQWEQTLEGLTSGIWCKENCTGSHEMFQFSSWQPAVVFSPDRQRLYLVHADQDRLTIVDFASRQARTVEIQAGSAWLNRLLALTAGVAYAKGGIEGTIKDAAISPDGSHLYVVGRSMHPILDEQGFWQYNETSLGLQVVDVESGRLLEKRDIPAYTIQFTPGGMQLLLSGWKEPESRQSSETLDARTLERNGFLQDWEAVATRRMDGQPVFLATRWGSSGSMLAFLDPGTLEITGVLPHRGSSTWMVP